MNQGYIKDLSAAETKELHSLADLIFVETIATGFYELKELKIALPDLFPHGRIYSREKVGEILLSDAHFAVLIETNDEKFLFQSRNIKIPEYE